MANGTRSYWGGTMPPFKPRSPRIWSEGYVHVIGEDWYLLVWTEALCYRGIVYRLRPYRVLGDLWDDDWQANQFGRRNIVAKAKSFLKAALGNAEKRSTAEKEASCDLLAEHAPAVLEFMTALVGPDGEPRKTATITLFAERGMFHVVLSERQEGLKLFASGSGLLDALRALDGRLIDDPVDWQVDDRPKGKPRR